MLWSNVGRKCLLVAGAGVALAALAFPATPAAALTRYAMATGQSCAVCHLATGGGGPLTAAGQAFAAVATHSADPAGAWAQVSAAAAAMPPAGIGLPRTGHATLPHGGGPLAGSVVLLLAGLLGRAHRRG